MSTLARAPERNSPCQRVSPSVGRAGQVIGQGRHLEHELVLQIVGFGHHPPEPGLRLLVVGPVHEQQPVEQEAPDLLDVVGHPPHQFLGVVRDGGPVPVTDGQVLGPDRRAVGRLPPEAGLLDDRRDTPPDDGVPEAGLLQDLRHLGDVPEHVGQVADVGRPAEGGRPAPAPSACP